MNFFSKLFSRLFRKPKQVPGFETRLRYEGVGLEKVYVYAQGQEATLEDMLLVLEYVLSRCQSKSDSGTNSATEQWDFYPSEDEPAVIKRIAIEIANKHPGFFVITFAWPDTKPTLIAGLVTVLELEESPFSKTRPTSAKAFKAVNQ